MSGDFQPAGGPPIAGEATGRFTTAEIAVDESTWRILGGRVALRGKLGRGEAQDWSVSGRAANIDPSKFRKELPGRLAFDFRGEGSGFDENAPWSASIAKLSGQFRGQRASGSGGVRHGKDQTEFQDVKLALGPARLEIDGVLGRAANLDARVVSDDLSAFLPELGGRVNATLLVRERTLALGFTGHDLAYGSHRAVILSADAHIDRDGREHSWLRLRSNGITLGGFAVTDTRLSLDGLPKDHALTFRVGAGQDAVALRGRGAWVDDRYTLQLEEIAASGPRVVPWRLESATRLAASREDAGARSALPRLRVATYLLRRTLEGLGRLVGEGRDGILPARSTQCKALGRAALPWIARRRRRGIRPGGRGLDRRPARRDPGRDPRIRIRKRRGPRPWRSG